MSDSSEAQGEVWWFNAASSRRWPARIYFSDGRIFAIAESGERREAAVHEIKISSRLGQVPRRLTFAGGTVLTVADNDYIDSMLKRHGRPAAWLHRLEAKWRWLFALAAAGLLLIAGGVLYGVPATAVVVADAFSHEHLRQISDRVYTELTDGKIIKPSQLPPPQAARARRIFTRVARDYGQYDYRLRLHDFFTANAFALPDGLIVATDRMITLLNDQEITAVFAHEIGHVEHRHSIRALVESASVLAFLVLASGDVSGLLAGGSLLLNLKYSRNHERHADCFAYYYLRAQNMNGLLLGQALEKMTKNGTAASDETKPVTEERGDLKTTAPAPPEKNIWRTVMETVSTHPHSESRKDPAAACIDYAPGEKQ